MDNKEQTYRLLRKQNGRMFFKAILYYIFTPFLIPLSLFCLGQIGEMVRIIGNNFAKATNIFKNVFAPKSYTPLKVYKGEYDDVEKYFTEKGKGIHITDHFLLLKTNNSFDIIPKSSVVWVYGKEETQRLVYGHGHTPMQTTIDYSVVICSEYGKKYQVRISQSNIGMTTQFNQYSSWTTIDDVVASLPNIVLGYNQELEKIYKNNPRRFLEKSGIIKD